MKTRTATSLLVIDGREVTWEQFGQISYEGYAEDPAFSEAHMGNYWSVDLRHYLLPEGKSARLSPRGRRLFEYWTEIVSQATQYEDPTTLQCRRRPGRRPCGTVLTISFDIDTNDVIWFCPRCQDEGRIAGWESTFWDNGALEPENPS